MGGSSRRRCSSTVLASSSPSDGSRRSSTCWARIRSRILPERLDFSSGSGGDFLRLAIHVLIGTQLALPYIIRRAREHGILRVLQPGGSPTTSGTSAAASSRRRLRRQGYRRASRHTRSVTRGLVGACVGHPAVGSGAVRRYQRHHAGARLRASARVERRGCEAASRRVLRAFGPRAGHSEGRNET